MYQGLLLLFLEAFSILKQRNEFQSLPSALLSDSFHQSNLLSLTNLADKRSGAGVVVVLFLSVYVNPSGELIGR